MDAPAGAPCPHCNFVLSGQQVSFPSTSPHLAQGLAQGRCPLCLSHGGKGLLFSNEYLTALEHQVTVSQHYGHMTPSHTTPGIFDFARQRATRGPG